MTIDEAIAFCNEKSKNIKLKTEPETFEYISSLLTELKELRSMVKSTAFKDGYIQGKAETRAEIHTALIDEMAMLNEAGLTENNLKTFAYRVKDIIEQLEVKYDQKFM